MTIEDRFIQMEVKISFQEDTVQELNKVVCQQQKMLDQLEATCRFLLSQVKDLSDTASENKVSNERPPHY
ncbi:SlyX family protein [Sulfurirhabdus autotrophica]|uniref:Protein SlyX homolog n=1 Tax=Sulfurirhabdus autotrophica TaxID=1706046 RepID=A0A4R3Y8S3_9PROT|nr:SlyX family protein [Sulfurirhabdus autotrophica]TCV86713.1 SlyX protein [Sulfurirhabdus autotrophica]